MLLVGAWASSSTTSIGFGAALLAELLAAGVGNVDAGARLWLGRAEAEGVVIGPRIGPIAGELVAGGESGKSKTSSSPETGFGCEIGRAHV